MLIETLKEKKGDLFKKSAQEKAFELGFPTRKNEAFSYVDLKTLEKSESTFSQDGYSIKVSSEKVKMMTFDQALDAFGVYLSNNEEKRISKEDSFFSLMNRGWGETTHCFFLDESAEEVIEITEEFDGENAINLPRLQFFVLGGVEVKFHHKFTLKGSKNVVSRLVEVSMEENSKVTFYETGNFDFDNDVFFQTRVNLKKDAFFTHRSGTLGCRSFRNEIKTYLHEEGATCHLEGFWNGKGKAQNHHLVHCSHLAENTHSRQHYQGVTNDESRSSFEGQIYVDKSAQKTDSYQLSKHLLIGEKARGFSKPNLEVFADDVKASHGATISMLDEEELFYLKSRGIPESKAADLLKEGFLSFFIDDIKEEKVKESFCELI